MRGSSAQSCLRCSEAQAARVGRGRQASVHLHPKASAPHLLRCLHSQEAAQQIWPGPRRVGAWLAHRWRPARAALSRCPGTGQPASPPAAPPPQLSHTDLRRVSQQELPQPDAWPASTPHAGPPNCTAPRSSSCVAQQGRPGGPPSCSSSFTAAICAPLVLAFGPLRRATSTKGVTGWAGAADAGAEGMG